MNYKNAAPLNSWESKVSRSQTLQKQMLQNTARYLDSPVTTAIARVLLIHSVGVNEHFTGTGRTTGGHKEYLVANVPLSELPDYQLGGRSVV